MRILLLYLMPMMVATAELIGRDTEDSSAVACTKQISTIIDPYAPLADERVEYLYRDMKSGDSTATHELALSFVPLFRQMIIERLGPGDPDIEDLFQKLYHPIFLRTVEAFDASRMKKTGTGTTKDRFMIYLSKFLPMKVNRAIGYLNRDRSRFVSSDLYSPEGEEVPFGLIDRLEQHYDDHQSPKESQLIQFRSELEAAAEEFLSRLPVSSEKERALVIVKRAIIFQMWINGKLPTEMGKILKTSRQNIEQINARMRSQFVGFLRGWLGEKKVVELTEILQSLK